MEPENSLLCLKESATVPCPEPDESCSHSPCIQYYPYIQIGLPFRFPANFNILVSSPILSFVIGAS
jgi:hypothetical protein